MSTQTKYRFPFKGQIQGFGYANQPEGSSPTCNNVVPYDPQTDRLRGSQRMGTNNWNGSALNSGTSKVTRVHQAVNTSGTLKLAAVSGNNVYIGSDPTAMTLATSGSGALSVSSTRTPHSADIFGKVYFVDGTTVAPKILDLATATVSTLAASTGSLPGACKVCANFRGRLVLGNDGTNPQNIYMSRAGTATDWDYSQQDALAAVSLNASTAGRIGESVTALINFSDDRLIVGCSSSIYILKGDPADGGIVLNVSDIVGMPWKDGYTTDSAGNLYFMGTGGFYRMSRDGNTLECLSKGRMDAFFSAFKKTDCVNVAYDRDRKGVWIFSAPFSTGTGIACWYDERADGFFPANFPDNHAPFHVEVFEADVNTDRLLMLGGRDGFIRKMDPSYERDDNATITSSVYFGPMRLNPAGTSIISECEFFFGDNPATYASTFEARWQMYAGKDPTDVVANPLRFIGDIHSTAGRQLPNRKRLSGDWFALEVYSTASNVRWAFEELIVTWEMWGKRR